MVVSPVIDVRSGVAVRAVAGDRSSYMPLATPLAASADPVDVARGYLSVFGFRTLYVADLDGIEGRGADRGMVMRVASATYGVDLWVDDGSGSADRSLPRTPVIGTESVASARPIKDAEMRGAPCVLSLDFRGDAYQGPSELLDDASLWPERVIVMTLARVGMDAGPDLDRVRDIVRRANGRRVYAAGGVRGREDLVALHEAGAAGALVATALHEGKIRAGDLREIAGL
jgi:phosphoribosylformimino-5-aminoimidazole carboxamide ribotide isomerase